MNTIDDIIQQLPKNLRAAVQKGSEVHTELLPLASVGLTKALGGGVGKGRMVLTFGNTSAGKSLLWLSSIALNQRLDPDFNAAWIDTEASFTKEWAQRIGVDTERLIVVQKIGADAVTDIGVQLLQAEIDMLVVDSISQMIPAAFIEEDGTIKEFDKTKQIGAHAKSVTMMTNSFNFANRSTVVSLLSQTTTNIAQMYAIQEPHGGQKVQFASSQIIKLNSSNHENKQIKGEIKVGDRIIEDIIGRKVDVVVTKNKLAKPFGKASYDVYYAGELIGIDHYGELVDEAINLGIIIKGGAWLKYGEENIQGREKFVTLLKEDEVLYEKIKGEVDAA